MNNDATVYLAGMGMITALGADVAMTAAALKAEMSGYQISRFVTHGTRQPITQARIPDELLESTEFEFDEGGYNNTVILMAVIALRQALAAHPIKKPVPLILAVPEPNVPAIDPNTLIAHLTHQRDLPLHPDLIRTIDAGRAAGIEGLVLARHLLIRQKADYVMIGGTDSHADTPRLRRLEQAGRLLTSGSKDGFAPGEGAGFLLLTCDPNKAITKDRHVVKLCEPGIGHEPGHLGSDVPCLGEGLDQTFKQALRGYAGPGIGAVYSSMNGERHWAKEHGVAMIRNVTVMGPNVRHEHPAEGLGDLGAATAPVLIALAADDLLAQPGHAAHLVYACADGPLRAAVRVEKILRGDSART